MIEAILNELGVGYFIALGTSYIVLFFILFGEDIARLYFDKKYPPPTLEEIEKEKIRLEKKLLSCFCFTEEGHQSVQLEVSANRLPMSEGEKMRVLCRQANDAGDERNPFFWTELKFKNGKLFVKGVEDEADAKLLSCFCFIEESHQSVNLKVSSNRLPMNEGEKMRVLCRKSNNYNEGKKPFFWAELKFRNGKMFVKNIEA